MSTISWYLDPLSMTGITIVSAADKEKRKAVQSWNDAAAQSSADYQEGKKS